MTNESVFGANRPYQSWGTDKPGHIVFLVDLSGSMEDKIDYVIKALQSTCENIVAHCWSGSEVKDRVSVSIYGYNYHLIELLKANGPELANKLVEVGDLPIFDKTKEAKPEYQTCMKLAFDKAQEDVKEWIAKQEAEGRKRVSAPIVINITDGEPYEGDNISQQEVFAKTKKSAQDLMNISTKDGNVRIFNVHYDLQTQDPSLSFPTSQPTINDNMAFLYQISSPMYEDLVKSAQAYGFTNAVVGAHCMLSNEKDPDQVAHFIEWGSSK
ncbi:MAG: VWA domain-containing protein [Bacteroidaceae bacterium]|nr:VWA domain-containing protein [Bacteroidaceae bacterium]